jgi:hypothetical protein
MDRDTIDFGRGLQAGASLAGIHRAPANKLVDDQKWARSSAASAL